MLQEIRIIGNLGGEPDLRKTNSGQSVCNFSVAANRKWNDNQGQKQEEVTWFRISVWGSQGEACEKWLGKGSRVYVAGRLTPDKETGGPRIWTDNNGVPNASYEVSAFKVLFLDSKSDTGYNPNQDIPV